MFGSLNPAKTPIVGAVSKYQTAWMRFNQFSDLNLGRNTVQEPSSFKSTSRNLCLLMAASLTFGVMV
jgi:hypothetical protein